MDRRLELDGLAVERGRDATPLDVERELRRSPLLPGSRQQAARGVEVEQAIVQLLALAEGEQIERVVVVGDEDDSRVERAAVDRRADGDAWP